jgi:hypothetical protein
MIEVVLFIPTADNDGQPFSVEHNEAFEAFATALFGGLTRYNSEVQGLWTEGGVTYRDRSTVYGVALPSITDGAKVGELVRWAKSHFRQLAIFVKYLGIAEIL